jgi:ppGpp synthetase/RelA/SpoT-type nucleotidyltranferase
MHIPVQVLHLDRGMVTSWPQVLIAVVELLENVKVVDIHKIKDELRNYKNSTYMTIPLSHYWIQMLPW